MGAYPQETQGIDPGNGAPSSSRRVDVHHLDRDALISHPALGRGGDLPVPDHTHIQGGSSHVDGEEILMIHGFTQIESSSRSCRRPRSDEEDGARYAILDCFYKPAGEHEEETSLESGVPQPLL